VSLVDSLNKRKPWLQGYLEVLILAFKMILTQKLKQKINMKVSSSIYLLF